MIRFRKPLLIGALLMAALAGTVVIATTTSRSRQAIAATYYCPMHPTYTADRPGQCPICSMTLVKREPTLSDAAQTSAARAQKTPPSNQSFGSICYLHHCPKLHAGRSCPMTVVAKPGESVTCPICGTHVAEASGPTPARTVLYWTDPMIPGYKADRPGKSPMGMDLVPVYQEDTSAAPSEREAPAGYAPILLTPQKQQLIGVKSASVERRALTKRIRTVGTVAHDPELYQAEEEFIQAYQSWQRAAVDGTPEATVGQAKRLVDSSRLRLRHLGLSDEMIDDVQARTEPDHRLLIGGAGSSWIYASIYEYELPFVHPGQEAAITVDGAPGRVFAGTVKAIDPMLDAMTRTARARIVIEDPEGMLKPEMYVNVSIVTALGEALAVPSEAIFFTGERQLVFIDKGQGLFEPHDVVAGAAGDGSTEIIRGVSEGDLVVTSGNFLIDSESRLKGALEAPSVAPQAEPERGAHQHGP